MLLGGLLLAGSTASVKPARLFWNQRGYTTLKTWSTDDKQLLSVGLNETIKRNIIKILVVLLNNS